MGSVLVPSFQDPTMDLVAIDYRIQEPVSDPVQPGSSMNPTGPNRIQEPEPGTLFLPNATCSKGVSHSHAQKHHIKIKHFESDTSLVTTIPNSETHLKFISNSLEVGEIDNSNNS